MKNWLDSGNIGIKIVSALKPTLICKMNVQTIQPESAMAQSFVHKAVMLLTLATVAVTVESRAVDVEEVYEKLVRSLEERIKREEEQAANARQRASDAEEKMQEMRTDLDSANTQGLALQKSLTRWRMFGTLSGIVTIPLTAHAIWSWLKSNGFVRSGEHAENEVPGQLINESEESEEFPHLERVDREPLNYKGT